MALIQTVHLSMANFKSAPVVPAVQNDTDRQIKMVIDDFNLTAGLTGKITFVRSDGTHYEASATLDTATNSFTADIDQALTQPGRTMVQLKVTDTLTVSTFSFVIFVEEDTSGTVTPQEGIDLMQAVEAAEDAADRAESAASTFETDTTLSVSGMAADAKTVGDDLDAMDGRLDTIEDDYVTESEMTAAIAELVDPPAIWNEIDNLSEFGSKNICPIISGTSYPGSLTLVADGYGNYTFNGTQSSGNAHKGLFSNQNAFPTGIHAGDKILGYVKSSNPSIKFMVIWWVGGVKLEDDATHTLTNGYKYFDIPATATGMEIRLTVPSGTATNGDVVTPYLFADKTKYEYNEEIEQNTTDISRIDGFMPYGYIPVETTPTDGLVNKWNQTATPSGYAYVKQSVTPGEKYRLSGWYYGGNYPLYLFLNGDSVVSFQNEETEGAYHNIDVTVPASTTHIVVNGYTGCPASISKWGMVSAGTKNARDCVIVGVGGEYDYNSISTAISDNPSEIIFVDFGTYEAEVQNLATDKRIIGKDSDLCVLTGTDKDYDTPPIEIAGGIIKHFTVNMKNDEEAAHKGYCIHSDNAACADNKLIVEDCVFTCTGQHAIGMGIWQGENVLFKDCEFVFKDVEATPTHAPFFAHNAGTSDGVAIVRFHNCIFRGSGYALKLSSYSSNCTMRFEFINCTFESDTLTGDNMIWTDYVTGDTHDQDHLHVFRGKMPLMATSHGNNVQMANT